MSEEFETLDDELSATSEEISPTILKLAGEIAPWIKIIAIINLSLQVLGLIQSFAQGFDMGAIIFIPLLVAGIQIGLNLALLNWGNSMSQLSKEGSSNSFAQAMLKQKNYWLFLGIVIILSISFMIITILFLNSAGGTFNFLDSLR